MSRVKISGVWKTPAIAYVKVDGHWHIVSLVKAKVGGAWKDTDLASPPPVPALTYGASEGHFTITNYDAELVYTVIGATQSGSDLSAVSDGATITAKYAIGAPESVPRTMRVAAHGIVLDALQNTYSDAGCGPRSGTYCPPGQVSDTAGNTYSGVGTLGPWQQCIGNCDFSNCYGYFNFPCYTYHWTDYSGSGYTLIGNTWGKAI